MQQNRKKVDPLDFFDNPKNRSGFPTTLMVVGKFDINNTEWQIAINYIFKKVL